MSQVNTLSLGFNLPLHTSQLYAFRGAIAATAGLEEDLFHNHNNETGADSAYKYRYPLIQYRVEDGRAAIFALNEGAKALESLHRSGKFADFAMNGRPRRLEVRERNRDNAFPLQVASNQFWTYKIREYLPFNRDKFRAYQSLPTRQARTERLQRMLQNHIVAFGYGIDWQLPETRIVVRLDDPGRARSVLAIAQKLMAFDLEFQVNAVLPEGLGLGRKTAFGFGRTLPVEARL